MSRRSQKRKLNNKHYQRAFVEYWQAYNRWKAREPSRWRIFKWLKWKSERPHKPKAATEYAELHEKYGHNSWL